MEGTFHLSREVLRRLARRELSPPETAEALRHVGECRECAQASIEELEPQIGALRSALSEDEGPWHPGHTELAHVAAGVADRAEREIVESHLEDCALCREDLADLARLSRSRPRRSIWRVAVTAAAAAAIALIVILQRSDDPPAPQAPAVVVTTTTKAPATTTTTATSTQAPPPRYANAEWATLVATAISTKTLPFPRELGLTADVLRGSPTEPVSQVSPSGIAVDDARPRFTWPERDGATYVVSVFAGEEQVAQSDALTATTWRPPAPLPRGRTYVWQVEAVRDGAREILPAPPAPPAMFRIISKRERAELESARRLHPEDHVLHAALAARAGLRDQALASLRLAGNDEAARPLRDRYLSD